MIVCALGLVALIATDLEGEPGPVDQQSNHNLGVYTAFLGVADLAQGVFLLCFEVQRRDVVEHQRHIAGVQGVGEARGRDLVAILGGLDASHRAFHRGVTRRRLAQVGQDPASVEQGGRLGDPGDDQVAERLIAQGVEPELVIDTCQGVEHQL
jgi:hypothetical protein